MRDYSNSNKYWTESAKMLRSKIFDHDFQIKGSVSTTGPLANMSRFLQKLEHCSNENVYNVHNHLKQSKQKIQAFGIDPDSREAATFVVSSFAEDLGHWAVDHAGEIFQLDNIDAVTAYARVSFLMKTQRL